MSSLGDRIKDVRRWANLTQAEFSKALGINRGHVSKIETGYAQPSEQLVKSICSAFQINEKWLLEGTGEPEKSITEQWTSGGPLLPKHLHELGNKLSLLIEDIIKKVESDISNEGLSIPHEQKAVAICSIFYNSATKGDQIDPYVYDTVLRILLLSGKRIQKETGAGVDP